MQKEIRLADESKGIVCVTTADSRYYCRQETNPETGNPEVVWRPSVTWICDVGYPKGQGFERWLKANGDESDDIAAAAAERGFKVHRAIAKLNDGEQVQMIGLPGGTPADKFEDGNGGTSELTSEECLGVMSYVQWWEEEGKSQFKILASEFTVWPDIGACAAKYSMAWDEAKEAFWWAGTVDIRAQRLSDGKCGIIDVKTSLDIWPSQEMQVSCYSRATGDNWQAILQVNYRRNRKKKYKFTEVDDCFDMFQHAKAIWKKEAGEKRPLQRDYPLTLKLSGVPAKLSATQG